MYKPFLTYDHNIHLLVAGVPHMLLKKTLDARSFLINKFQDYLHNSDWEDEAGELVKSIVHGAEETMPRLSHRDVAT